MNLLDDLTMARGFVSLGRYSLVVVKEGRILAKSQESGLRPLLRAAEALQGEMEGTSVADRVTGRAAALVLRARKVRAVFGGIMSEDARRELEEGDLVVEWGRLVPRILSRDHQDPCPMEREVTGISSPVEAYLRLGSALGVIPAEGET